MKKLLIAGIVILIVLMIVPFKFGNKDTKQEGVENAEVQTVTVTSTTSTSNDVPANSASAIDAYLDASAKVTDGSDLDDGSYSTLNE